MASGEKGVVGTCLSERRNMKQRILIIMIDKIK
jgi:hypothetical protein